MFRLVRVLTGGFFLLCVLLTGIAQAISIPADEILYFRLPAERDNVSTLILHDLQRGIAVELFNVLGREIDAAWSPDGTRIAFSQFAQESVHRDIYIYDMTTRETQQITTQGSRDYNSPAWSPDGKTLAVHGFSGTETFWDLFLINLETHHVTPLVERFGNQGRPSFSPDGRYLVYETETTPASTDLVRYDLQTGQILTLTNSPNPDITAVWQPNGEKIVYAAMASLSYQLFLMTPDGAFTQPVEGFDYSMFDPSWSQDNKRIVFSAFHPQHLNLLQIYVIDITNPAAGAKRLTDPSARYTQPDWRPR